MTERNQLPKRPWQRALFGGLLSALTGGICFAFLLYGTGIRTGGALFFFLLGFGFPALIKPWAGNFVYILSVSIFWFLAGAGIGYFIKRNIAAVGVWLTVYAISFAISLARFAELMN